MIKCDKTQHLYTNSYISADYITGVIKMNELEEEIESFKPWVILIGNHVINLKPDVAGEIYKGFLREMELPGYDILKFYSAVLSVNHNSKQKTPLERKNAFEESICDMFGKEDGRFLLNDLNRYTHKAYQNDMYNDPDYNGPNILNHLPETIRKRLINGHAVPSAETNQKPVGDYQRVA